MKNISETTIMEPELVERKYTSNQSFRARYESCCGTIDKECFDFVTRMIFIFTVLIFAMIQVINVRDTNQHQIYLSIITSILGFMLPSPTLRTTIKS
tara:strand:+ start:222 stop:512 length:291 start_codon:yes stop_codon:yes gene_type:complete